MHLPTLLALASTLSLTSSQTLTSTLTQITTPFGPNPRNVSFYIYVPSPLPPNSPILVVPHWCHGTAQQAFQYRPYASQGDTYGFISIYPDSPNKADQCWDVSSKETLTHEGGGDAQGIVSMVRWALEKYKGDAGRVFVTGTSSGAMMTNVLLGSYPDVFAGGSAFAGVPFGCFAGDGFAVWSDACATGKIIRNGSEWDSLVRNAYPGYTGWRPKLQTFHGTKDNVLYPQNLEEQVKQWTSVFGVSTTPTEVALDTPLKGWTRRRYGSKFEAYEAEGVTHDIPNQADVVLDFFCLRCRGEGCFRRGSE
ncbi:acetylxylan esteras-like protein 1 precursor [Westerdykella ornata]|uniref:Carboxylic ester hydrolase n=1 Tax=Westerdykella ornata TaxID=318751 RepID=A0A6A6JNC7_WESOR|nr:acetylxylan esteras-like protein 1 precursor [Westerdykella ornata]KAF2276429.1 acetylxylan esteras-like protein 1 precursor [Westerdykella ornata]